MVNVLDRIIEVPSHIPRVEIHSMVGSVHYIAVCVSVVPASVFKRLISGLQIKLTNEI